MANVRRPKPRSRGTPPLRECGWSSRGASHPVPLMFLRISRSSLLSRFRVRRTSRLLALSRFPPKRSQRQVPPRDLLEDGIVGEVELDGGDGDAVAGDGVDVGAGLNLVLGQIAAE